MDIQELRDIVRECGIAGAGGAGFPSYAKLDQKADTILLNCAECEPLLKVHRQLLQKYPYEIMSTLQLIADVLEVKEVIIGVKEAYEKTVNAARTYLSFFSKLSLSLLKEIYPMGDEVQLIYETLGKVVPPGSIPLEVGVVVFNVETIYNIYCAVNQKAPVSAKYLTIAGAVKNPITVLAPIGMAVEDLVELAGGATAGEPAYIMGGPMTGEVVAPYDTVTKTTNAILVFPKNHPVVLQKQGSTSIDMKKAMASCCQCEMCTDLCPRNQLGHPITPHLFMRAATSGTTQKLDPFLSTMFCCSCGLCEMYACPQGLAPRKLITEYKNGLRRKGIPIPKGVPLKPVNQMREYRTVPMERLISRLGLSEYNVDAPLTEETIPAKQVRIKLNMHIGAGAVPVVHKGDIVQPGDLIAKAEEGKLSLPVHASIAGEVLEINDMEILVRAR
ncbi:MAG TPA: NADH-quinone oxidoreductase subunit J [Clostridiales bacterium]|nr:NADH-quinone oxidoreductase subunit J [Clostridiales bacterium]